MTSDRYVPAEVQAAVDTARDWAELLIENSEGAAWAEYYMVAAGMKGRLEKVLEFGLSGPGIEGEGLSGRLRLPIRPESIEKQVGEFRVPDHPGDDDGQQQQD